MKRKVEEEGGDYYTRLPRLPPEITINVIHIEHLKYVITIKDLCNWHATQKSFYKQWLDRGYLDSLLEQSKIENNTLYKIKKDGQYIRNIYNIKCVQTALTSLTKIIDSIPDMREIMEPGNNPLFSYNISHKDEPIKLKTFFTKETKKKQTYKKGETPLSSEQKDVLKIMCNYMRRVYRWVLLVYGKDSSTEITFPEAKGVFIESELRIKGCLD